MRLSTFTRYLLVLILSLSLFLRSPLFSERFGLTPQTRDEQIGYGLCDKENERAHEHVFGCLKTEVERIVAQRIRDQQGIWITGWRKHM